MTKQLDSIVEFATIEGDAVFNDLVTTMEANDAVSASAFVIVIIEKNRKIIVEILKASIRYDKPIVLFVESEVDLSKYEDVISMLRVVHRVDFIGELTIDLLIRETEAVRREYG